MRKEFNDGWRFRKAESNTYQKVCLPHDAMLSEKRTPDAGGKSASGYFPGGRYIYEKTFELGEEAAEKHITFEFEGVYKNAEVFINDRKAGGECYGYLPFYVCGDDFLKVGENVIRVEADNSMQPDSRWYSGAGIYRPVWMHIQKKSYIEPEGIQIRTISISPAQIEVKTEHTGGEIEVHILKDGKEIISGKGDQVILDIPDAKLWSDETPELYTAMVILKENNREIEIVEETFGIRQITWDKNGLYVNGNQTLLRGGCLHHDNGILGACAYDQSEERKIRILKANGFNAVRSSHNPCSKALLRACDRLGMYVMDETWDMWYRKKNAYDYANEFEEHYRQDIKDMVKRDFNHPSVILYSIGNEVSEPAEKKGVELAREMTELFHELDDCRPVTGGFNLMIIANAQNGKAVYKEDGGRDDSNENKTAGMNSTMFNMIASMVGTGMNKAANGKKADEAASPVLDVVDIAGYNYASGRYPKEGQLHPGRLIIGSETFPQDLAKNWKMTEKYPYLVGDFMWTAWDYLGEAGIGAWSYHQDAKGFNKPYPWLLADTGAFDILGNPTGEALWAKAVWGKAEKPLIAVQPIDPDGKKLVKAVWRGTNAIPSWSFRGCKGRKAVVEVYTQEPVVELYVNGKRTGKKKTKLCRAVFKIKYEPGVLEAVSIGADGKEKGRSSLASAKGKKGIQIRMEEKEVRTGDIVYADIRIAGENGITESCADTELSVKVDGCTLLGFGSANPRTEERFDTGRYTTYRGYAQAVIRADAPGRISVTVTGDGLKQAQAQVLCINEKTVE